MRVCRYKVLESIDSPVTKVVDDYEYENDDYGWGDNEEDYF
jgi:hypothetical protein